MRSNRREFPCSSRPFVRVVMAALVLAACDASSPSATSDAASGAAGAVSSASGHAGVGGAAGGGRGGMSAAGHGVAGFPPSGAGGTPSSAGAGGGPKAGAGGVSGAGMGSAGKPSGGAGGQSGGAGGASAGAGGASGGAGGSSTGGATGSPKPLLGAPGDFVFDLQDLGIGYHTGAALDAEIAQYGLGDVVSRAVLKDATTGQPSVQELDTAKLPVPFVSEWDYSALHIPSGQVDGSGLPRSGFPCFDELQGCAAPSGPGEAYSRARDYYLARKAQLQAAFPTSPGVVAGTGHYLFQHYGAAFGARMVVSEVGENINSIQAHTAFSRGASRQFGIPWGIDMSPWFANGVTDYWTGADRVWCEHDPNGNCTFWYSGPDHGHSLSLTRRTWYLGYYAGASYLIQEGASVNFFTGKNAGAALSPLGQLAQEFHSFVVSNPDRGKPFVPFAVVTDFYHGLGLGTWNKPPGSEVTWNHFPVNEEQKGTLGLLDALWPTSLRVTAASEANYLVSGPLGDTVDVLADLTDPASLAPQAAYRVLFVTGPVHWTPAWKSLVWNSFLAGGGWLVLDVNPTHDAIFSDLGAPALAPLVPGYAADAIGVANVLNGHVVRVASPSLYPALLPRLATEVLPFAVSGAAFALNQLGPTSWIATLVNDAGVDKQPLSAEVVSGGPVVATVSPAGGHVIKSVTALRAPAGAPTFGPTGAQISIPPGDVAVLRIEAN